MEGLILKQEQTVKAIQRSVENFKKLGKSNITLPVVEGRLNLLKEKWDTCQELDTRLQLQASSADKSTTPYFKEGVFFIAEDAFLAAHDYYTNLIHVLRKAEEPRAPAPTTTPAPAAQASVAKLPELHLPKFSGAYSEWPSFADLFESLVTKNSALTDVQRLQYLKGSLEGEARQVLLQIPTTEANFKTAWEALRERYENKRALISSYLSSFVNLPPVSRDVAGDLTRLRDRTNQALALLANIGRPTQNWDDLVIFILTQKLDPQTVEEWEMWLGSRTSIPTYAEFNQFLATRIRSQTARQQCREYKTTSHAAPSSHVATKTTVARPSTGNGGASDKCAVCKEKHPLYRCSRFRSMSLAQRQELVRERNHCQNCLRSGHWPATCPSQATCARCHRRHHTLLHQESAATTAAVAALDPSPASAASAEESGGRPVTTHCAATLEGTTPEVLLATALVTVRAENGRRLLVRALLDQGSESTFVRDSVVQTLRAPRRPAVTRVTGVGGTHIGTSLHRVEIRVGHHRGGEPSILVSALVLPKLTSYTPRFFGERFSSWEHLRELDLADPVPRCQQPVDLIIGADYYGSLIRSGLRRGPPNAPVAQETILGWIVSGPLTTPGASVHHTRLHCVASEPLDESLRRFWELEEINETCPLTELENRCEEHFKATHSRSHDGRYVVRLPFREGAAVQIGESFQKAFTLLRRVESRLQRDPQLSAAYHDFLNEYEAMGHMSRASTTLNSFSSSTQVPVYLPHHPVVRTVENSTKLRVVFNASSRTTDGSSLNDHLLVGPKLQSDILTIVSRWRTYRYVYKADIVKMFRQIRVDPRDVDYQRILWRPTPSQPPTAYQLLTVTYGTASAPFLANRVLKQLALDDGSAFPRGRDILENHFYVDDALFGADDVNNAIECKKQLIGLLNRGGFPLRKWASNSPALLPDAPPITSDTVVMPSAEHGLLGVLGLAWHPSSDTFHFRVNLPHPLTITKRGVLSVIARLYDPLGWLSPLTLRAKTILQELWIRKIDWDVPLASDLTERWRSFCESLPELDHLSIPRWVKMKGRCSYQLHGFADASIQGYAAAVYIRVSTDSETTSSLLVAKTKVAPIKTVSVPRLELCGAVLLTRLMRKIISDLRLDQASVHCWTDSTVVLSWLSRHPSSWQTFVANRVSEIHTSLSQAIWRHTPTHDNPADCASRGLLPEALITHPLWWHGPLWLTKDPSAWPSSHTPPLGGVHLEERPSTTHSGATQTEEPLQHILDRLGSWPKILRVTAYCLRFVEVARHRASPSTASLITADDVSQAKLRWLRYLQLLFFRSEIESLSSRTPLPRSSRLRSLHPFLDATGLLRVGGRLSHAPLPYDEKHPVILPPHYLSKLIAWQAHLRTLHGGPQLTLRVIRQNYWLIGARSLAKALVHNCVTCTRYRKEVPQQLMGDLPVSRVTPTRPFAHTGIDYAGPVAVRLNKGRGHRSQKAYIALFICLVTKAVHLELVSDYTTQGFLAAFKRFISRRGRPSALYSDHGTNFQGAAKDLQRAYHQCTKDPDFQATLASDMIQWHFIPPGAPHWGGLWEAGVKSAKHHLRRVMGDRTLTFEELTTLLCLVEACLNSRPISALSADPDDLACLTPGHFLIGGPLLGIPELAPLHLKDSLLTRWQLVHRMQDHFWNRWRYEYLHGLQQRGKWKEARNNLTVGDLVLIRSPNAAPAHWPLGRVVECHPGRDGRVRVASLRTASGVIVRPITQFCLLPLREGVGRESTDEEISPHCAQ